MTDNNWITPEWISDLLSRKGYRYYVTDSYWIDKEIASEINKEIKNILDSAEKRDCKDCKHEPCKPDKKECIYCFYAFMINRNWTPKEGK